MAAAAKTSAIAMRSSMTRRVLSNVTSIGDTSTSIERRATTTNENANVTAASFQNERGKRERLSPRSAFSPNGAMNDSAAAPAAASGMPTKARMLASDGPPGTGCHEGDPMTVK